MDSNSSSAILWPCHLTYFLVHKIKLMLSILRSFGRDEMRYCMINSVAQYEYEMHLLVRNSCIFLPQKVICICFR